MNLPAFARALLSPASPRARRAAYLVALVVAAALAAWHSTLGTPVWPVDDAYISLHNAQALRWGHDPRFSGTPALVGSTSAIHVVLITIGLLFLKALWAQWLVAWLGALAYVIALLRLAFVLRASVVEAALAAVAGVIVAQTPHHLMNGLETGWAMAGLTWAIAAARDRERGRVWELPVACALLPFLRPELVVVTALLMLERAVADLRHGGWRALMRTAGWFAAALAPWLIVYWITTGTPYPNTIEAKRNYFAEGCLPDKLKWSWVKSALEIFRDGIGSFAWAGALLLLSVTGWSGLAFMAAFAFAYWWRFPGALNHYEQRYLYLFIPWLIYGVAQLGARRWLAARVAAAALFALCIWQSSAKVRERWQWHLNCCNFTRVELAGVAQWLTEHVQPDEKVLVHDAGYVGYAVRARLVDLVGLKTPSSLGPHRELTWKTCGGGRGTAISQIARAQHPDYLVVLNGWDGIYGITKTLRDRGWGLESRYSHAYSVYQLSPPP
jgi:hypothetical protein